MSNKAAPTYNPPPPPTLQTADQIFSAAGNYANTNFPTQMAAQATALNNANNPNYYAGFQPTSFEQALGNQSFQNIWPDEQALIKQQLSQSGMSSSPVQAETLGRAYGNLGTQVGSFLSQQGDARAQGAINAGLNINPMSFISPYASTDLSQSNNQAQLQYGYQQSMAQQQYQQQMNKYQQQQALGQMIGQVSPIGGQIYGASTGTSGSALSGTLGTASQMAPYLMMLGTGGLGGAGNVGNAGAGGNMMTQTAGYGGGTSNAWNQAGGVGRAESVYPNLSFGG